VLKKPMPKSEALKEYKVDKQEKIKIANESKMTIKSNTSTSSKFKANKI